VSTDAVHGQPLINFFEPKPQGGGFIVPHSTGTPLAARGRLSSLHLAIFIALGTGLAAGAVSLATGPVLAQGFWSDVAPAKVRKIKRARPAAADDKKKAKGDKSTEVAERPVSGPLVLNVSLSRQRLMVYDATGLISESPVSSGRVGYSTPMGVFTVVEKARMHHSNLYSGAPMPHMQRITWSGVALHAGVLPGYAASHGCIRLPAGYAKKLYGMTKVGTRVIVSRDPVVPKPITSARLFAAYPPENDLATGSTAPAKTRIADASQGNGSVAAALGVATAAASETGDAAPAPVTAVHPTYRERRQAEMAQLSAEIRAAGYEKMAKGMVLAEAARAADATRPAYLAARADADREAANLAKLEKAKAAAERELADLEAPAVVKPETGKKRKKAKVVDEAKKTARIEALKTELADAGNEIEPARIRAQTTGDALKTAEDITKAAEGNRRAAMSDFSQASAVLAQALAKEQAAKRRDAKRDLPVSIFVSRAKQRLYVRQGWDDIFDAPVTIARPEEPIGTHVFTALAYTPEKTAMQWSVVSIPYDPTRAASKKRKDKAAKAVPPPPAVDLAAQTAQSALDRIDIPEDVREQIADVMKPGSSLVVSDVGLSGETGEYTDFIVPLR
jgi:lipoprotein-anchoring transpeptidase ErfK/SrfK